MRKLVIGVMGPGESATTEDKAMAYLLGYEIAKKGWVLLSGGRKAGVMGEVNRGYKEGRGTLSIGISPTESDDGLMSEHLDVVVFTGMKSGRNYMNILSSDIVVAIGDLSSAGTLSEVAFALIKQKQKPFEEKKKAFPIIFLGGGNIVQALYDKHATKSIIVSDALSAIDKIEHLIK